LFLLIKTSCSFSLIFAVSVQQLFSLFLRTLLRGNFIFYLSGCLFAKLGFAFLGRFIRPEDVPAQYGGLSRPSDLQNGPPKPASEFTVKGGEKVNIQIEGIEVPLLSLFISAPLNLLVNPLKRLLNLLRPPLILSSYL